jgi:hypothetical protein
MLRSYVPATHIVLHYLEGSNHKEATTRRAVVLFTECEAVERWCGAELAKCRSNLRKLGKRVWLHAKHPISGGTTIVDEALSGVRAAALLIVGGRVRTIMKKLSEVSSFSEDAADLLLL